MRLSSFPERLAAGVFILNAGVGKLRADADTARGVHAMAVGTYPFLSKTEPEPFLRRLGASEVALGAALVLPVVSDLVAGTALTAFAGGLLGLYLQTPGMRAPREVCDPPSRARPSPKTSGSSDGLSLMAGGLRRRRGR